MNCIICNETLGSSSIILATPCGHLFHDSCLMKWIKQSRTCPHCRSKSTTDTIIRLYPNFAPTISKADDVPSLNNQIDSLSFELRLKRLETKNLNEQVTKMGNCELALRHELKDANDEVCRLKSQIYASGTKMEHFKKRAKDADKLEEEIASLKRKLTSLQSVSKAINGSYDDVVSMCSRPQDNKSLQLMVCALKKDLTETAKKRRDTFLSLQRAKNELLAAKHEMMQVVKENSVLKNMNTDHTVANTQFKLREGDISKLESTSLPDKSSFPKLKRPANSSVTLDLPSPKTSQRTDAENSSDSPRVRIKSCGLIGFMDTKFAKNKIICGQTRGGASRDEPPSKRPNIALGKVPFKLV